MDVLTRERAKPTLPFAGHYQLIDFPLSSIAHSGIRDVWLSVQFQPQTLHRHVASGRPWDLDRTRGGLRWAVPEEGSGAPTQSGFSQGNADDLYRMRDEIAHHGAEHVVVMSSDSVWAIDLGRVLEDHIAHDARCTVVTTEVTRTQAKQKAVVTLDSEGWVTDIEDKPSSPSTTTIATEIFVYEATSLLETLDRLRAERHTQAEEPDGTGLDDFSKTLLPALIEQGRVWAHAMEGYWRDLGTPQDYLTAHRDLLAGRIDVLAHDEWPILTRFPELPPARIRTGAVVEDSVVTNGCDIRGTVRGSVLGPGVVVEKGAVVEDSVIFARTHIAAGAHVSTSIVDSKCRVGRDARVGAAASSTRPGDSEITLVGRESAVSAGAVVAGGARLEPGTTA